jgi:hypothetical protein
MVDKDQNPNKKVERGTQKSDEKPIRVTPTPPPPAPVRKEPSPPPPKK